MDPFLVGEVKTFPQDSQNKQWHSHTQGVDGHQDHAVEGAAAGHGHGENTAQDRAGAETGQAVDAAQQEDAYRAGAGEFPHCVLGWAEGEAFPEYRHNAEDDDEYSGAEHDGGADGV